MGYVSEIFEGGLSIRYLQACNYIVPFVKGETYIISALEDVKRPFEKLNDIDSVKSIQDQIDGLNKKYKEGEAIKEADVMSLKNKVTLWRDRLIILLRKEKIVGIPKDCILNLEMLMEGVNNFFQERYWNKFSDIVKADLTEGAFCILVGASTAASIILFRAVEGILREYYLAKTGNEISGENFIDWDRIIQELRALPRKNQGLLDHLNYLRLNLRNPAAHPDKIFLKKESEVLFSMVIHTLEEIGKEIYGNNP